ncbi:MAG TPA: cation-transporting P-type ATPase [Stellaceae bacterium]|nr:cation-transporting P-type ATPase [Stellaceae bacterium]
MMSNRAAAEHAWLSTGKVLMKIQQLSVEAALSSLGSNPGGLSAAEAGRRTREYGANRIEKIARAPAVLRLFREFVQFFSVILWVAAGLAFVAEWSAPGQGMARIGYALIGVILVSGIFSFWQEYRVEQTLNALQELLPRRVNLLRGGTVARLPADQLVPGDLLLVEQGEIVPADCRLTEAFALRVSNATVTGEAMPQARDSGPSQEDDPIRSRNILLAGTSVVSGQGKAVVFATGPHTEFGKIAHLAQTADDVVSPLRRQLAYLSRLIAALAVGIGLAFFAIGTVIDVPFWQDFIFSIGIIVAMVPEGLLPTLTLALVLAAQRLARRNVLIRHLGSVETLGSATVICTDKTGTLTENRMQARELLLGRERYPAAAFANRPERAQHFHRFFEAAHLCHDLKETEAHGSRVYLGDPMEAALVEMAGAAIAEFPAMRRLDDIPFDTDRMRHSVLYETTEGPVLYCKGAPEAVLPLCRQILDEGSLAPLDGALRETIIGAQEAMAGKGLRILAFAMGKPAADGAREALERDLVFLGLVGLEDPPRPEVPEAIRKCHDAGIKVIMVTGDHPHTAVAIAREIGLVRSQHPAVVSGEQVPNLSGRELDEVLRRPEVIFARVAADQKMRIVEALKNTGQVVAVTGDGVNDAPALKAAHIGIAMGIAGTEVARAAADMVLLDDNFASIVNAVEEGRAVFQNIRKFLTYVLVHNVAELVPFLGFALAGIPLALTPIQALAIDMGTDSLTALGLGVEEAHPQAMRQPPRSQHQRLMSLPVALRAYLFLGVIEAGAAMAAFFFVLVGAGWSYGQSMAPGDPVYLAATTACLSAIIVMQIVNVFLCRSSVRSVFASGIFSNRLILWGVVLEIALLLAIDYTPWGNLVLETTAPPAALWVFMIPFAGAMLVLEELRKWLVRRTLSPGPSLAPPRPLS